MEPLTGGVNQSLLSAGFHRLSRPASGAIFASSYSGHSNKNGHLVKTHAATVRLSELASAIGMMWRYPTAEWAPLTPPTKVHYLTPKPFELAGIGLCMPFTFEREIMAYNRSMLHFQHLF